MSTFRKNYGLAIALPALLLGIAATSIGATAAPMSPARAATALDHAQTNTIEPVRHRRWGGGGIGIYIGPSYGYGYYPRSYGYYPRYRSSYYDDYDGGYYRPYRRHHHNRRWARERFEHPLGRR